MSIDSVNSSAHIKYSKNGNPYQECRTGKKVGAAAGAGFVAVRTIDGIKSGAFKNILNSAHQSFIDCGITKLDDFVIKNPKLYKYGTFGVCLAIALGLAAGVGKLVGHGVDKIVENKRAKEADKNVSAPQFTKFEVVA